MGVWETKETIYLPLICIQGGLLINTVCQVSMEDGRSVEEAAEKQAEMRALVRPCSVS